ncbi:hypothetical protein CR513_19468, partial [Mucuna pruriens]
MPKKSGMTVVKIDKTRWCRQGFKIACEFVLITENLRKQLARTTFLCLLLIKHMQIHIALVDQHKTTFTCPFGTFAYTKMSFGLYNALSTF